jgi:uncharacterized membrane protein HdeD (DUF308 family)
MVSDPNDMMATPLGLEELRSRWLLFLVLGVCLIVLGLVALGYTVAVAEVYIIVLGVFLLVGAGVQLVQAILSFSWRGVALHLLTGVLYGVLGLIMLRHPDLAARVITLFLAAFYTVGGLFRIAASLAFRFSSWPWLLLSGVVTFALGVIIWAQWPWDSLVIIGLFIGIDLVFNGWSWVMVALTARQIGGPRSAAVPSGGVSQPPPPV